jgi:hypothetical protein
MANLRIEVNAGLVVFSSLGAGLQKGLPLWEGITASEDFPIGAESANYMLSLEKEVSAPDDVFGAEDDLIGALEIIASVWPFSGGSHLPIETRRVVTDSRFSSNAAEVEAALLAERGRHRVTAIGGFVIGTMATYSKPPLESASRIAMHAHCNFDLRRLLDYYYRAWMERGRKENAAWAFELYKVRDHLVYMYGSEEKCQTPLGIQPRDWNDFGNVLNNNDLRHSEKKAKQGKKDKRLPPTPENVNRLYELAWQWTAAHLRREGLI